MASLEILGSGHIDQRESAFPMAVQLNNGELLCSFGTGGGALVTGQTEWARSTDLGETWNTEGVILEKDQKHNRANFMKLTRSPGGDTVYAYGSWVDADVDSGFGQRDSRAILCLSTDQGHSWSEPKAVPFPEDCPLEVSHGLLHLPSGRLLAPAATLASPETLGARVYLARSDDQGSTWNYSTPFYDPDGQLGYFEQKFAQLTPDHLMGVAWTVTLGEYADLENHFVLSEDGGTTWGTIHTTGIQAQTMTPIPLGRDRLLVLYNQRHGSQAIKMALVRFRESTWQVVTEEILYDARTFYQRSQQVESGIDELDDFQFGFPTGIVLQDGDILTTHWCHEQGHCGIRWTKLRVHWKD